MSTSLRQIEISNRLESLADKLRLRLTEGSLFQKRQVLVPSRAMKLWLQVRLADADANSVVAGVEFRHLQDGLVPQGTSASRLELALAIDSWLQRQEECVSERRRVQLADRLAALFQDYSLAGHRVFTDGKLPKEQRWQLALWEHLFGGDGGWKSLGGLLSDPQVAPAAFHGDIHLFGFAHIPSAYQRYLDHVSLTTPVYDYILSPTHLFWSDLRSERESLGIRNLWSLKGATLDQQEQLTGYLVDCNPLLANLGRMGRERAYWLEESAAATTENYWVYTAAAQHEGYIDLLPLTFEESVDREPLTCLRALQTEILCLTRRQVPLAPDASVQIHHAPSKRAEIEILYDALMTEIAESRLMPGEVVVLVSTLADYLPYIEMVFGAEDSKIPFSIADLPLRLRSPLVSGFELLLDLVGGRWTATRLLQLWESPGFARRHGLNTEDVQTLREWVRQSGIQWGFDWEHRQRSLREAGCVEPLQECGSSGTWCDGFRSLLTSLAQWVPGETACAIEFSQVDLFGRWMEVTEQLYEDLSDLRCEQLLTCGEWTRLLKDLLHKYFVVDAEELDDCFRILSSVGLVDKFSFVTIRHHLLALMSDRVMPFREQTLNGVRFGSFSALRALPAEKVVLLGMDENSYPRSDVREATNVLLGNPLSDYVPSQQDQDRYFFIEALLSARSQLWISYSDTGGEEAVPSIVVSELLDYFGTSVRVTRHPFHRYSSSYFSQEGNVANGSISDFEAAKAAQAPSLPPHLFLPIHDLQPGESDDFEEYCEVVLDDIFLAARDPARLFLKKECGVRLFKSGWRDIQEDEPFELAIGERFSLLRQGLLEPLDQVLSRAKRRGSLPVGTLGRMASAEIGSQVERAIGFLAKEHVYPEDIYNLRLSGACRERHQIGPRLWEAPAPLIRTPSGRTVRITGTLENLCGAGLISNMTVNAGGFVKVWPHALICGALSLGDLVCVGEAKRIMPPEGSQEALAAFLDFVLLIQRRCFPVMPDWIHSYCVRPEKIASNTIAEAFEDAWGPGVSDEVHWLLQAAGETRVIDLLSPWAETLSSAYGERFKRWASEGKG